MGSSLDEIMDRLANVLNWFGRHDEATVVTFFARLLRKRKVDDLAALAKWVNEEGA
jgi:hypothetical protein